mgnify:CR=1 FL=1
MNQKIVIQISLLLIVVVTSLIFYTLFLKDPNIKTEGIEKDTQESKVLVKKKTNQIKDIVYNSNYSDNNRYIIKAEFGEFNTDDSDTMLLTNVTGTIYLENSESIKISSTEAKYNSVNYNTKFYQNVSIVFDDHQIYSDNFDLFFDKKISTMYGNVIYKNLITTLHADKIDIDLITKDSKIYMLNKSKKIIVKNLN